jgi:hypothetical protein
LAKEGLFPEGVDWPYCRKCFFLIFFPSWNHVNLNIVKKDHVHQKMVKIGWPQITFLASDHLKWAHSSALGPFFIPKTKYLWLPYTMQPSRMFKIRIQGGQMSLFGTLAYFSKGNGWNSVSHQPLDLFPSFLLQWYILMK